jgi:hypothetical protein
MAPIVERDLQNLIAMRDEEVLSLITRLLAVRDYPISGVNPGIYANPFLMVRPSEDASDDSPWGTNALQNIEALSAQICLMVGISWATMSTGICSRQAIHQRVGPLARSMVDKAQKSARGLPIDSVELLAALNDYLDGEAGTPEERQRFYVLEARVGWDNAIMLDFVGDLCALTPSVLLTHCERLTQRLLAVRKTPRWWWRGSVR